MNHPDLAWIGFARQLQGPSFALFQRELTRFNRLRLEPALPSSEWRDAVEDEGRVRQAEGDFVEAVRAEIAPLVSNVPDGAEEFIAWFEGLKATGPGQNDALFPWLATQADREQMKWFIEQEVAGEAGFDDLLA